MNGVGGDEERHAIIVDRHARLGKERRRPRFAHAEQHVPGTFCFAPLNGSFHWLS